MRIPPPLTEALLRLPAADNRLPALKVGQQLQVLVEGRRQEGLLLNVLGQRLTAQSALPASAGERLTVQVQSLQPQLALKVLEGGNRATDTQALMARLLPRQGPVGEAFGQITRAAASAEAQIAPGPVRDALARLSQALPQRADAADPARLRLVLERSGLFMERLLATRPAQEAANLANTDLKALLQRAAASLRAHLGAGQTSAATAGQQATARATPAAPATPLPPGTAPVLEGLLGQVESALSRIQLLQLQPAVSQSPMDLTVEIPLRDGTEVDNLYLRIRKEDQGGQDGTDGESGEPVYQLVVRLDFEQLGTVQATLRMQGEKVSAVWHSTDPRLSEAIERHLPELDARIRGLGLEAESLLSVNAPPPRSADDIRQPPTGIFHEQA